MCVETLELDLCLGKVTQHERRRGLRGVHHMHRLVLPAAVSTRLAKRIGFESSHTRKACGCLARDHVGVRPGWYHAGIGSASRSGENNPPDDSQQPSML